MRFLSIRFITKAQHSILTDKHFTLGEIMNIAKDGDSKKVSKMTKATIEETDCLCQTVLFSNSRLIAISDGSNYDLELNKDELNYVKEFVRGSLVHDSDCTEDFIDSDTKCYEIIIYPANTESLTALVVVGEGFLSLVTKNAESLSEFYRDLIRHSIGNKADAVGLNREYLSLKMINGYLDLVKLRLGRNAANLIN